MNGHLELVLGIEGNLTDLPVPCSVLHHITLGEFSTLEDGSLRSVSGDLSGHDTLTLINGTLPLSSVTKTSHTFQGLPASSVFIESNPCLLLSGICLRNLIIEPHVSNSHPVLSECSSLVGADTRCGSKSFYSFQVLDQASLCSHPLGSESEAHGDIGHNDTNKEDDGIEPIITQDKCNDEEGDTEE